MHRILVDTETLLADAPALDADARRHLKVVRAKPGETVELFDGKGTTRLFTVRSGGALAAEPDAEAVRHTPPASRITLFACVTKQNRWDWMVEKVVELGVTRIVPVLSERCVVKLAKSDFAAKRERWLKVAEEAARQSHAVFLPEIAEPVPFSEALELAKTSGTVFVGALVSPPPAPLAVAAQEVRLQPRKDVSVCEQGESASSRLRRSADVAVWVGPEGDFTPDEMSALLEIATPVSFGPTVLRAETAAIFAVAVLAALRSGGASPSHGQA